MSHRSSLCLLLVLCACSAPTPNESELRVYYDSARWFQLRDAVDEKSPAFYRGAVAIAFQDLQTAEKHFGTVIESDPGSEHAHEARVHLLNGYHRAGRYQKALSILNEALAHKPDAGDLASARDFYSTLVRYPQQEVDAAAPSQISYSMRDGNMFVPLRINGKPVDYIVDTGAGLSVASESEEARLGMSVSASNTKVEGSSGKQLGLSTAVAAELSIGGARLRNVAFFVFGDDQMPFNELPQQ